MPNPHVPSHVSEPRSKAVWLPVVTGFSLAVLVVVMWRVMVIQEDASLGDSIRGGGDYLASLVETDLDNRIQALNRMARSWEIRRGMGRAEFEAEARSYLVDVAGVQALERVDRDYIVRWVIPLEGNEKAENLSLLLEKKRRDAFEKAERGRTPSLSLPIELVQSGEGVLLFFPTYVGGDFDGCILAVLRLQDWLDSVFSMNAARRQQGDFMVSVLFDEKPVYALGGRSPPVQQLPGSTSVVRVLGHTLSIHVQPTESFVRENRSPLLLLNALFGILLSALFAFIVRLYQRSSVEAWRAHSAGMALETEMRERAVAERELQRAFVRIEWATKAAHMGVWTWDLSTDQLSWNERMFELMDVPPDVTPVYATWRLRVHPDDIAATESLLQSAIQGKSPFDTEFRICFSGGTVRYIRAAARVERDADGKACFMTGLNWDVSSAREAEAALKQSEERVRLLLNSTAEAIYGIDLDGNCIFANASCARILGYPNSEVLLGKNMHSLIHHSYADGRPLPVDVCRISQAFREVRPSHVDDEVLWRADGTCFPAEYWSYPQFAHDGVQGAVVTFIDITERKRAEDTIRHMATHDGLTDLPSLTLCRDRLAMAVSAAHRNRKESAVMFLDLDGFKAVNDTWGHDAGDEVLRAVAKRLCSAVRETDTVARIGGDEFLLVITELQSRENAVQIAGKVLELISDPFFFKGARMTVGVSIGIALYPQDGEAIDDLIKLADEAMYRVKKRGKNGYQFSADRENG